MEDMEFVDQCIIFVASKLPKLTRWRIYIAHHFVYVFGAIVSFGLPWTCHEHCKTSHGAWWTTFLEEAHTGFWGIKKPAMKQHEATWSNMKQHEATNQRPSFIIFHHHDATIARTATTRAHPWVNAWVNVERCTRAIRPATLGVSSIQQCLWMRCVVMRYHIVRYTSINLQLVFRCI